MASSNNTTQIPYGYCQCGCGQKTNIAKVTCSREEKIKGRPVRFLTGHRYSSLEKRFWPKVAITADPDKCWLWQGNLSDQGYGKLVIRYKRFLTHRLMWELVNGEIPDGLWVLHNCPDGDNPTCCNPKHLFIGTQQDNIRDMIVKKRNCYGEKNVRAKLTTEQVQEIRLKYATYKVKQATLATEYGVSIGTISHIITGRKWKNDYTNEGYKRERHL